MIALSFTLVNNIIIKFNYFFSILNKSILLFSLYVIFLVLRDNSAMAKKELSQQL